jgi:hypothetical protein
MWAAAPVIASSSCWTEGRMRCLTGPRAHPERVLLRRAAPPGPDHEDRQPPRPAAAGRGGLALPARTPARRPRQSAAATGAADGAGPRLVGAGPPPRPPPRAHGQGQALDGRQRGGCQRAVRLHLGGDDPPAAERGAGGLSQPPSIRWGGAAGATLLEEPRENYAIRAGRRPAQTRDTSARQLTTQHCHAVPTRESQSDVSSSASRPSPSPSAHPQPARRRRSAASPTTPRLHNGVHLSSTSLRRGHV